MTILQLYLIEGLVKDQSINSPTAWVGHDGLAHQGLLNGSTFLLLGLIVMDVVEIVYVAKHSLGAYNLGSGIHLKVESWFKEDKVGGITLEKLKIGAANISPLRCMEKFVSFAYFDEVKLAQFISQIIIEEILNDKLMAVVLEIACEIHGANQF
jgi:hypothetical protein